MVLGIGSMEVMVIALALLLLFGPEHVPRAMHALGRAQGKLRRAMRELEDTIEAETRPVVEYPKLPPTEDGVISKDRE